MEYGERALNKDFYNEYINKSRIGELWLDYIEKELGYTIRREFYIKDLKCRADGYDINTNTIYEFHGDYFHGNPDVFDQNKINSKVNKTFKFLYDKTIEREDKIKNAGYTLIVMWENNFRKILNQNK